MGDAAGNSSKFASIIVPCWNQLEFTRQCIAALVRCTRSPWELVVVNNGSTDGTGEYLAGVQDASSVPVTVIANSTNLGFPAAINQGLKYSSGEYLVLLNNGAVVTEGWLEQLIALTRADLQSAHGLEALDSAGTWPPGESGREAFGSAGTGQPPPRGHEASGNAGTNQPPPSAIQAFGSAGTTAPPVRRIEALRSSGPTPPLAPPSQGGESSLRGALRGVSGWSGR